ncbi:MAG: ribonuclease H [Gemmatimonadota bacterium]
MSARYPLVSVYADESCLGNGRAGATPGGFGALVEYQMPGAGVGRFDLWGSEPDTTNNRMALRSVTDTFRALSRKGNTLSVQFTTDSRYIVDGMTSWVRGWMARGWKRSQGAVENLELWQAAVEAVSLHDCQWVWVKGHAGHPQNEYANHLATRAAAEQSATDGLVPSSFEVWWSAQSAKSRSPAPVSPFPTAAGFKAAPALGPALRPAAMTRREG